MDQLPLIGITSRRARIAELIPQDALLLGDATTELTFSAFGEQLATAGALPVPVSWSADVDALLDRLDGLVLSGGEDIDPTRSGAPAADVVDRDRDALELRLLKGALDRRMPVLGVCRGMQLINVALGGTLGLAPISHDRRDRPFLTQSHTVEPVPDTVGERLTSQSLLVNSVHRQAVDSLAAPLRPAAWSPDGVLEALESPELSIVGVQWHPEFHADGDPAFAWLVQEAATAAVGRGC